LPPPTAAGDIGSFGLLLFGVLAGQSHPTPETAAAGPAALNGGAPTALSNLCRRLVHPGCYASIDEAIRDLRAVRDSLRNGRPMPAIAPPPEPVSAAQNGRAKTITRKLRPVAEPAPVDGALVGGRDLDELSNGSASKTQSEQTIRRSISPAAGIPVAAAASGQGTRPPRRQRSLFSRVFRSVFWFAFLLLLGPAVVIGGFFYITWLKTTPEVTVPDLHGYNVEDARAVLGSRGLKLQVDPAGVFDAKVLPGEVLTQMPVPGQHTKSPRSVKVVLSRGTQTVHVPPVVGKSLDDAISTMRAAGLRPVNRGEMSSSTVPNGNVARQWPLPGNIVARDTEGSLRVSAGPSADDMEARSPSAPEDRTVTLDVPADKPKSGIHWLSSVGHGKTEHPIEIREVSEAGDEKTLWHGIGIAGQKWEHVVTVEPFNDLRVYMDGHAVHTRLDLPQKSEGDGEMAANP
ncbi:MAG: PASTA domain-containing protein, partial [Armatimonadota bacterium]|nr:PASTA domain-containing protein [Armatimonadota bacterium]